MQYSTSLHAVQYIAACSTVHRSAQYSTSLHAVQYIYACTTIHLCMQCSTYLHAVQYISACSTIHLCMQTSTSLHCTDSEFLLECMPTPLRPSPIISPPSPSPSPFFHPCPCRPGTPWSRKSTMQACPTTRGLACMPAKPAVGAHYSALRQVSKQPLHTPTALTHTPGAAFFPY